MNKIIALLLLLAITVPGQQAAPGQQFLPYKRKTAATAITAVTDSFNRADNSPLNTTMSDGVGTWNSGPGAFDDVRIVSNQALGASGNPAQGGARVATPAFAANQKASVTYTGAGVGIGPAVRLQGSADASCYIAWIAATTDITVYKVTDTGSLAFSSLATYSVSTMVNGDIVAISVSGTSIETFVNGVSLGAPVTDATWATGQPGFITNYDASVIDAFSATDL